MGSHGTAAAIKVAVLAAIGICLVGVARGLIDLALAGAFSVGEASAGGAVADAGSSFPGPLPFGVALAALIIVDRIAPARFNSLKLWPGLIVGLILVPGVLGFEIFHASGGRNTVAEICVLAAVIVVCWLVMRQTRPAFDAESWEAITMSHRSLHGLTLAQAQGKQRLSAYLFFFIPLVCLGLTAIASQAMAPLFAGIGFVFCLWGAWQEVWLSPLRR